MECDSVQLLSATETKRAHRRVSRNANAIRWVSFGQSDYFGSGFTTLVSKPLEKTQSFHYFLLFCYHVHRECFGEGLNWAGCTLIALLGQENRFEALDFCYHIVKVYAVDSRDEVVGGVVSEQSFDIFEEEGWRSGESACLPPMWPGLDSGPVLYAG